MTLGTPLRRQTSPPRPGRHRVESLGQGHGDEVLRGLRGGDVDRSLQIQLVLIPELLRHGASEAKRGLETSYPGPVFFNPIGETKKECRGVVRPMAPTDR